MPIHDQSYRRYRGRRESAASAWSVIAVTGITAMVRRRRFLALLLAAWVPFVWRGIQVYVATSFPQAAPLLAPDVAMYRGFLEFQGFFVFMMAIYAGAGLIANDRRANALQIYLSKPLTRADYVGGKMAILVVFLLLVTWVPAELLLVLQVLLAGSFEFARDNLYLFPAITLYSLLVVLVASVTMLALSSLSSSSRFVGVLYTGAVLFTDAMFNTVRGITGSTSMAWMSFPASLTQLGDLIFRVDLRYDASPAVCAVVVVGLIVVSISVLERRVRGVEIVT